MQVVKYAFQQHGDDRGQLVALEEFKDIPFEIKRAHWIYDVPGGQTRGGHAYIETQEFIVAMSGSFDVILHESDGNKTISLNRSYYGLYVPAGTWRELCNFSSNSLALVLSSTYFDVADYIDNYNVYQRNDIDWNMVRTTGAKKGRGLFQKVDSIEYWKARGRDAMKGVQ